MDTECASHTRGALAGLHEHEQHEQVHAAGWEGYHKFHFGSASRRARGSALENGEARTPTHEGRGRKWRSSGERRQDDAVGAGTARWRRRADGHGGT